jgi:hypothetical protein
VSNTIKPLKPYPKKRERDREREEKVREGVV